MGRILIVRSAQYTQLEQNLESIKSQFPGDRLYLLEHRDLVDRALELFSQDEIISFPFANDVKFSFSTKVTIDAKLQFDHLMVMVRDKAGRGQDNLLEFAYTIEANNYWMINSASEIDHLAPFGIVTVKRISKLYIRVLVGVLFAPAILILGLWLLLKRLIRIISQQIIRV